MDVPQRKNRIDKLNQFLQRILQEIMKKIVILWASNAWLVTCLSKRTSETAYYIIYWLVLTNKVQFDLVWLSGLLKNVPLCRPISLLKLENNQTSADAAAAPHCTMSEITNVVQKLGCPFCSRWLFFPSNWSKRGYDK
jgi:hypothetical protein